MPHTGAEINSNSTVPVDTTLIVPIVVGGPGTVVQKGTLTMTMTVTGTGPTALEVVEPRFEGRFYRPQIPNPQNTG